MDKRQQESGLLRLAGSGDNEAFRTLVDNHKPAVHRTCMGFVHSSADAEDITQEVFMEVFRSLKEFRGDSEFSTWLYRITVNKSLNYLRTKSRSTIFDLMGNDKPVKYSEPAAGGESYPDRHLLDKDKEDAIKHALEKLPLKQKTALILSKYDDLPNMEIAEIMQLSLSSVESLIFRAKKNMRKILLPFYKKNME